MSDEDTAGDEMKSVAGEDSGRPFTPMEQYIEAAIQERYLSLEDASRCLNTLGKDESGMRYAYLALNAIDRKLTDVSTILNFRHVLFVDVSGNFLNLERLSMLANMPYLILLKAQRNRIESLNFPPMPYLQVIDFSRNQILDTGDLEQPMLNILSLNFNQIYTVRFKTNQLPELTQLEMRGNCLQELSGTFPVSLQNLYLGENRINRVHYADLAVLVNLRILHLRDNHIRKLDGFSGDLVHLNYLNLRRNSITKFRQFRKLSALTALETLIVTQNPVAGDLGADEEGGEGGGGEDGEEGEKEDITRIPLLVLLPNLKRVNKVPVTFEERQEARELREEKMEEIMGEESSDDEQLTTTATTTPGDVTD